MRAAVGTQGQSQARLQRRLIRPEPSARAGRVPLTRPPLARRDVSRPIIDKHTWLVIKQKRAARQRLHLGHRQLQTSALGISATTSEPGTMTASEPVAETVSALSEDSSPRLSGAPVVW
jgi:hypothetical protein